MTARTTSELLFEELCARRCVSCARVPCGTVRTPDYDIMLHDMKVVVEVKELSLNDDDQRILRELSEKRQSTWWNCPGVRVRNKIDSAKVQLRNRAKGRHPSILVLFDNTANFIALDDYNILVGMYGLETVHFTVPSDPALPTYQNGHSFGPKQRLTAEKGTSISALAWLYSAEQGTPALRLYHNIHAATPLRPWCAAALADRQFAVESTGSFNEWHEIDVPDA